jgi:hypothetical protein
MRVIGVLFALGLLIPPAGAETSTGVVDSMRGPVPIPMKPARRCSAAP